MLKSGEDSEDDRPSEGEGGSRECGAILWSSVSEPENKMTDIEHSKD